MVAPLMLTSSGYSIVIGGHYEGMEQIVDFLPNLSEYVAFWSYKPP